MAFCRKNSVPSLLVTPYLNHPFRTTSKTTSFNRDPTVRPGASVYMATARAISEPLKANRDIYIVRQAGRGKVPAAPTKNRLFSAGETDDATARKMGPITRTHRDTQAQKAFGEITV